MVSFECFLKFIFVNSINLVSFEGSLEEIFHLLSLFNFSCILRSLSLLLSNELLVNFHSGKFNDWDTILFECIFFFIISSGTLDICAVSKDNKDEEE